MYLARCLVWFTWPFASPTICALLSRPLICFFTVSVVAVGRWTARRRTRPAARPPTRCRRERWEHRARRPQRLSPSLSWLLLCSPPSGRNLFQHWLHFGSPVLVLSLRWPLSLSLVFYFSLFSLNDFALHKAPFLFIISLRCIQSLRIYYSSTTQFNSNFFNVKIMKHSLLYALKFTFSSIFNLLFYLKSGMNLEDGELVRLLRCAHLRFFLLIWIPFDWIPLA